MKFVCDKCGGKLQYIEKYDAHACLKCDTWEEIKCHQAPCEFCEERPDKPSEAIEKAEEVKG